MIILFIHCNSMKKNKNDLLEDILAYCQVYQKYPTSRNKKLNRDRSEVHEMFENCKYSTMRALETAV